MVDVQNIAKNLRIMQDRELTVIVLSRVDCINKILLSLLVKWTSEMTETGGVAPWRALIPQLYQLIIIKIVFKNFPKNTNKFIQTFIKTFRFYIKGNGGNFENL